MSNTTLSPNQIAGIKRSNKYKALITVGLDPETALAQLVPTTEKADPRIAQLVEAGFSEAEAREALGLEVSEPAVKAAEPAKPASSKEQGETLVESQGFAFTRGRVYVTPDIVEAAVRVRKTGHPEVIASSGVGRTTAVLLYREDSGDVAIQNLMRPQA